MITTTGIVTCWDCKTKVAPGEAVKETRQTSGGDGVTYPGDFTQEWVHADRRACFKAKEEREYQEYVSSLPAKLERLKKQQAAMQSELQSEIDAIEAEIEETYRSIKTHSS